MTITRKKIILFVCGIVFIAIGVFVAMGIFDYLDYRKTVQAASAMPWQDGGVITKVMPQCILDTPAVAPVTCQTSCPLLTPILAAACTAPIKTALACISVSGPGPCAASIAVATACIGCFNFTELTVTSQHGTQVLGVPVGYVYKGGGTFPKIEDQYIAGGSSNVSPWVIGIPGVAASRTQKIADTFKLIIAGIKE